jgi:hypothetical protein
MVPARIVEPEETSLARQWLGKHVPVSEILFVSFMNAIIVKWLCV